MSNAAPLPAQECRTRVTARPPDALAPGEHRLVETVVENRATVELSSSEPQLVLLASRWFDAGTNALVAEGPRTRLEPPLRPGQARRCRLRLVAPDAPGEYLLRITPLQEFVAWFDDLDPKNGWAGPVRVAAARAPDPTPELPQLAEMAAEVAAGPEELRPSAFWEDVGGLHAALLRDEGFARFKRSINSTYFQFMVLSLRDEQLRAVLRGWLEHPSPAVLRARLEAPLELPGEFTPGVRTFAERWWYTRYVAALWEVVRRRDRHGILERLEEPALGAPITVRHRGRAISQDLCNSALELIAIMDGTNGAAPAPGGRIVELGGGYGRVAWAALSAIPDVRVVLVDIPPALAVAERYLTTLFPDLPTFRFRRFDDAEQAAAELEPARLAFLTPNQLERLPPIGAQLAINISSLHEMRPDQIRRQLEVLDRHCDGHVYTKQWESWHNPVDGVTIRREDYPYPAGWRRVFERRHPIQRRFFEALLATR